MRKMGFSTAVLAKRLTSLSLSVLLLRLNERFACQLSPFPFIYSEIAPQGNVYRLIKCGVGRDFKSLINAGI